MLCVLIIQLCLTLYNPMDYSLLRSSVRGILQAGILEWDSLLQGLFLTPGWNPHLFTSPAWQTDSLPLVPLTSIQMMG